MMFTIEYASPSVPDLFGQSDVKSCTSNENDKTSAKMGHQADINDMINKSDREYEMAMSKLESSLYERYRESKFISMLCNEIPFALMDDVVLSNRSIPPLDGTANKLYEVYEEVAKQANPKTKESAADRIIWFNVRGKSVCLLRSTILAVIPNSQLAVRVGGDWSEQDSTLDREGRILIVSNEILFDSLYSHLIDCFDRNIQHRCFCHL